MARIKTHHQSLKEVIQTLEQLYYLSKLLGYNFAIEYRDSKGNVTTDALSWLPAEHI